MKSNFPSKRKWIVAALILLVSAVTVYFFPIFRVVKIETARQKKEEGKFNAPEYVDRFWNETLPNSLDKATDAAVILPAIKTDPAAAKTQYSHQLGMGNTYYYFIRGEGRVVSVKPDSISLSLEKTGGKIDVIIATSNIYGNTVRDGSGLLNVNDFPSSQEFNQISAEINKRIEAGILPNLKQNAKVGATVNFAGCAEIAEEKTDLQPLRLIPVKAQIQ